MGTYIKEWPCCGSETRTEAWEPSECPFCKPSSGSQGVVTEEMLTAALNVYHSGITAGWAYGTWERYRNCWPSEAKKYEEAMRAALLAAMGGKEER